MNRVITLTNVSGVEKTYAGQTIADTQTYTLQSTEHESFKNAPQLFADVASGAIQVGDGTNTFTDVVAAWSWIRGDVSQVEVTQKTPALGGKVAVHSSPKPEIEGIETFVTWTGAGDDVSDPENPRIGEGDLLNFQMTVGQQNPVVTKDVYWDQTNFGRVWIHEAYLKFTNGGNGDYISAYVMAKPTTIYDSATVTALEAGGHVPPGAITLDLVLDNNDATKVLPAPDGPGTGTHGFGAAPALVPRTFSKTGAWDYDGFTLTPNLEGTGSFDIYTVEMEAHRYVNKVPCYGDCATYFMMSSDETAEIRNGYFVRIECFNNSGTNWQASVLMEIYRQRTI